MTYTPDTGVIHDMTETVPGFGTFGDNGAPRTIRDMGEAFEVQAPSMVQALQYVNLPADEMPVVEAALGLAQEYLNARCNKKRREAVIEGMRNENMSEVMANLPVYGRDAFARMFASLGRQTRDGVSNRQSSLLQMWSKTLQPQRSEKTVSYDRWRRRPKGEDDDDSDIEARRLAERSDAPDI